jgi:pimeloyl-ACP methyl ester carboxylesterase
VIAFERHGDGPPVVLLHGANSDRHEWRHQIEALKATHTVIAWDAPALDGGLPEYADALAAFLGEQGIVAATIVGLSFGGTLALELHRRHPERVAALVLVSAYAGWGGSLPPDEVRRRVVEAGDSPLARSFAATDLRPHLPAVRVPVLVLHGTLDPRAPRPVAEGLAAGIPGARLEVIEGAGHDLNTEAPDAVTEALRRFLA